MCSFFPHVCPLKLIFYIDFHLSYCKKIEKFFFRKFSAGNNFGQLRILDGLIFRPKKIRNFLGLKFLSFNACECETSVASVHMCCGNVTINKKRKVFIYNKYIYIYIYFAYLLMKMLNIRICSKRTFLCRSSYISFCLKSFLRLCIEKKSVKALST